VTGGASSIDDVFRLRRILPIEAATLERDPLDPEARAAAAAIIDDIRRRGVTAVLDHGRRLGDLGPDDPLVIPAASLSAARIRVDGAHLELLERTAGRIRRFAEWQLDALRPVAVDVQGGRAGHRLVPVARAGCYAPGGRYPLPSTVLMTAVTARVAGVAEVWVASPKASPLMLAAASVAGADAVLAVGGAQAIGAFAYGAGPVPACDVVAGPGNRWVTAAKALISPQVRIDLLAGPSELLILADGDADPAMVAADLLAQAEHDADAVSVLVSTSASLIDDVEGALAGQLTGLPTGPVARESLQRAVAVCASDMAEAIAVSNRIAPEHLQLHVTDADAVAGSLSNFGAIFVGAQSAHVFGDYGAGPNHVLPTGGSARTHSGLSVLSFLRTMTWLRLTPDSGFDQLAADAACLARLEGLEAHARAAEMRSAPRCRP